MNRELARATRREAIILTVMAVFAHWGMALIARQMATEIVGRLEAKGYIR